MTNQLPRDSETLVRRRPNLKDEAGKYIRNQILSGALRPGARIDQDSVADELGVSRIPVREALITLEVEGLVENVPRRGSYVALLTPDDIRDHYQMFGALSGIAARRAAQVMDAAQLDELDDLIEQHVASSGAAQSDQINYRFHQLINKAGSSRRLRATLRLVSMSLPSHFFEFSPGFTAQSIDEHRQIVAALRAGSGDAADRELVAHFRDVGEQAVTMLERSGYWDDTQD